MIKVFTQWTSRCYLWLTWTTHDHILPYPAYSNAYTEHVPHAVHNNGSPWTSDNSKTVLKIKQIIVLLGLVKIKFQLSSAEKFTTELSLTSTKRYQKNTLK